MKFFNRTWKLGVSLFLCLCLLSMTAFASEQPVKSDPVEETGQKEASAEAADEEMTQDEEKREEDKEEEEKEDEEKDTEEPVSKEEGLTAKEPEAFVREDRGETGADPLTQETENTADIETANAEAEEACDGTEIEPGTVVESGDCGFSIGTLFYKVTFLGEDAYKLTIYGTGKMLTIGATYGAPWHKYSEGLVSIEIQDGVESIAQYAFTGCDNVTSLTIPASVTTIYSKAFQMRGLKSVYFLGSWHEKFKPDAFDRTEDLVIHYDQNDASWEGRSFANAAMQSNDLSLTMIQAGEATCTKDGNPLYYYNEAWDKFFSDADGKLEITDRKELVIPALGHDWDEGVVTTEATAALEGVMTYTCLRCDEIRTEAIPILSEDPAPDAGTSDAGTPDAGTPDDGKTDEIVWDAEKPAGNGPEENMEEDEIQGPDEGRDLVLNLNLSSQKQRKGTPAGRIQDAASSAGSVKTADENNQFLYLVLLLFSFGAIILVIRRRINR